MKVPRSETLSILRVCLVCSWMALTTHLPAQELIPAGDVDRTMKLFNSSLGVECGFCHVENDWRNNDKPQLTTASNMWRMVQSLNSDQFAKVAGITCRTCHGGQNAPSRLPQEKWQAIADHWPETAASSMKTTMSVYSASLGVGCDFCHNTTDWKSDASPGFTTTRRMVAMFDVFPKFMPPGARTQCFMCHKGSRQPNR